MSADMRASATVTTEDALELGRRAGDVAANVGTVILGKDNVIEACVVALLAGGHVLIEDYPGVGKTIMTTRPGAAGEHPAAMAAVMTASGWKFGHTVRRPRGLDAADAEPFVEQTQAVLFGGRPATEDDVAPVAALRRELRRVLRAHYGRGRALLAPYDPNRRRSGVQSAPAAAPPAAPQSLTHAACPDRSA